MNILQSFYDLIRICVWVDLILGFGWFFRRLNSSTVTDLRCTLLNVGTVVDLDGTDVFLEIDRTEQVGLNCETNSPQEKTALSEVALIFINIVDVIKDNCNITLFVSLLNDFD